MSTPNEKAFKKLDESGTTQESSAFSAGTKIQREAVGSSGTEIYAGYFKEEYLVDLQGPQAALVYDKMRRSEAQVAMLLNAIFNPIKAASWEIEEASQDADAVKHAEFCRMVFFDGIDFEAFKHEALTLVAFGFSVFEAVHSVVFNHPKFGTFNGLKTLGFRSQKTIQSWKLEPKTGRIISLDQWAQGDIGNRVQIPGDFVVVFSNQKEGDNYEGISALRPMYGAYLRKQLYLKLTAIGVEKYAVGVPIGTVPPSKENTKELENFKATLEAYTSHEQAYITLPEGWKIDVQKGEFDASKIVELLKFENTEMINAVVANFLALGTNGSGGAFALSNDLSDFFTSGIQAYADLIAGGINRKLIPDLCKLNFGQLPAYPKMRVTGISDKAGKELAEIIKALSDSQALRPDMPLEEYIRRQYKMPKADPETAREVKAATVVGKPITEPNVVPPETAPAPTQAPPAPTPAQIKLAEPATANDYTRALEAGKTETKALMQARLKEMANALKKKLTERYNSAHNDAAKIGAATQAQIPSQMIESYKRDLREALAKVAVQATLQAHKEVPAASGRKLSEHIETMKLAAPTAPQGMGYFDALSPLVKQAVETQASLIADTQAADITKIVSFQFASSETGTSDVNQIESEIDDAVDKTLSGDNSKGMSVDAAAGDATAKVANEARTEYFFEPDVLDGIESFTFENNDPVSEICQELAGTTFAASDPQVDTYTPPLHHNCKSRMVPNLKGTDAPDAITGKLDISEKAQKSMTLCEHKH